MRPHQVLEDMAAIERRVKAIGDDVLDQRLEANGTAGAALINWHLWEMAKKALVDAVTFDFGDIAPTTEHSEFGQDLLERGMMALPFQSTFYSSTALGKRSSIVVSEATVDGESSDGPLPLDVTGKHPGEPHLALYIINQVMTESGDDWDAPTFVFFLHKTDPMNRRAPWVSIINGVRKSRDGDRLDADEALSRMGRGMRFMCGAASMLMSRDVQTRIEPAPAKLNAQRARKGRPAINAVHTIKIIADAERYAAAGESFSTHASPRMHWRRGHFRTIHRGEDKQRVVPVAPSLVGAKEEARHIVPKEYVVDVAEADA